MKGLLGNVSVKFLADVLQNVMPSCIMNCVLLCWSGLVFESRAGFSCDCLKVTCSPAQLL